MADRRNAIPSRASAARHHDLIVRLMLPLVELLVIWQAAREAMTRLGTRDFYSPLSPSAPVRRASSNARHITGTSSSAPCAAAFA